RSRDLAQQPLRFVVFAALVVIAPERDQLANPVVHFAIVLLLDYCSGDSSAGGVVSFSLGAGLISGFRAPAGRTAMRDLASPASLALGCFSTSFAYASRALSWSPSFS